MFYKIIPKYSSHMFPKIIIFQNINYSVMFFRNNIQNCSTKNYSQKLCFKIIS